MEGSHLLNQGHIREAGGEGTEESQESGGGQNNSMTTGCFRSYKCDPEQGVYDF